MVRDIGTLLVLVEFMLFKASDKQEQLINTKQVQHPQGIERFCPQTT